MSTDDAKRNPRAPLAELTPERPQQPADKSAKKRARTRYRSPQRRFATAVILSIAIGYSLLLLILIGMETRLVYPGAFMEQTSVARGLNASIVPSPSVAIRLTNQSANPQIETVPYGSTDGVQLSGRLLERGDGKEIVLFFHGNGCKAAWLDGLIHELSEQFDANVMAAEYRGFADEVTPTEEGVIEDSLAARDYLCDRYHVSPKAIVLYGQSLGGGCAVAVAANGGAKALILERTFDRLIDVAAEKYPFIPVHWVMRNRYDSIAKLTVYHDPLIVIHGTEDTLIPISHGRRLYDSARCERKQWIEVSGLGHIEALPVETLQEVATTLRRFTETDR